MLTVKQLIARLKKMPPDAIVAIADHDQSDDEISGYVGNVEEASDFLQAERGIGVVIRP